MFLPSNITLQFGDSGDFVSELQRRLATVGTHGSDAVSGMYDGLTVNSVSAFQARNGLRADGIAGPETLRRLNGIISGDTSSDTSSSNQEEEAKQAAQDQFAREAFMMDHPPVVEPMPERRNLEERLPDPEPSAYSGYTAPATLMAEPNVQEQIAREAQMQREVPHQATHQNHHDTLAQMLLQQAPTPESRSEFGQRAQAADATGHPPHAPAAHHAPAAPAHPTEPVTPTAAPQPAAVEPAKGLVGRALQKVDAFIEKLGSYFETKLPPHVMSEVKELGEIMARSGVKEAPIPTGPEQVRGQQLPARGPEQQIPQRG